MQLYFFLFLCLPFSTLFAQNSDKNTTLAEWDSLGQEFVQLLNEQDTDMDYYFASIPFWKRIVINNPKNSNVRQLNRDLLQHARDFGVSDIFINAGEGVSYDYLRSRADSVLIVRQRIDELEFNYLFFKIDYLEQEWKVVDIYFLVYDTYLSDLIRNTVYFPILFEALERENANVILENSKIYREAKHLYGEGEYERAYLKLSGIPLEERLADYQIYKIFLSIKLEEDKKLLRSVEEYQEKFKGGKELTLLLVDYYIVKEDYQQALASIDKIDSIVGGDPHLAFYKAIVHYLQGEWKVSATMLEKTVLEAPEEEYYISFLITVLVENRAYKQAIQLFKKLEKGGHYTCYTLKEWVHSEYPVLATRKPFRKWARKCQY